MYENFGRLPSPPKPAWLDVLQWSGDSITADSNKAGDRSGFRHLFAEAVKAEYDYVLRADTDVVGIQAPNTTVSTYPWCGLSGIRTDQLLASYVGNGLNDGLNADLFAPGIVNLNIGTNDRLQGVADATILANIGLIIDAYKVANPNVKVVVSNLIDNNTDHSGFVTLSAAISAYLPTRDDYEENCFLFDSFAAMGAWNSTDWNGVTHMSNAGNIIYLNALYARMKALFA